MPPTPSTNGQQTKRLRREPPRWLTSSSPCRPRLVERAAADVLRGVMERAAQPMVRACPARCGLCVPTFKAFSPHEGARMNAAPGELLALDGRRLESLTATERAVFQQYRDARPQAGQAWISVGLSTAPLPPIALLCTSTQAKADEILQRAGTIVCVRAYPAAP